MTAVTPQGFIRTRLADRLQQLKDRVVGIFGSDINLDADSMDGQTLGIFAEAVGEIDQLAEDTYQSFDPNQVTGLRQAALGKLNGLQKQAATHTTVEVLLGGSQGTLIPAGSVVKSSVDGTRFATGSDATIPAAGTIAVTVTAVDAGAITADPDTVVGIDTPIFGWQSVTNPAAAIPGRDAETDEAFRIRRAQSTSNTGQAVLDAMYGALANLIGVVQCRVFENDKDVIDPDTGLPPHSIEAVVRGGDDQEIAQTLWAKKGVGPTLIGNTTATITDSQGMARTMTFQRPAQVPIYIVVNVTRDPGYPVDGASRIKAALAAYGSANLGIGDRVIQSRLYGPVNTVPSQEVTGLFIGTAPGPTGTATIVVPFDSIADIDESRIVVNES